MFQIRKQRVEIIFTNCVHHFYRNLKNGMNVVTNSRSYFLEGTLKFRVSNLNLCNILCLIVVILLDRFVCQAQTIVVDPLVSHAKQKESIFTRNEQDSGKV